MATPLADFFEYNLWANRRLLEACAELSDAQLDATTPGVYGTIRETLLHMFGSEESYARDFTGTAPEPQLRGMTVFPGIAELQRRAELSGSELIKIAETADLRQTFWLDGGTYKCEAIIVLMQALTHAVDHRSQIATLLSVQGITPPHDDVWGYNDALTRMK
jgi:uncharacterized damage-inducible protein DinB